MGQSHTSLRTHLQSEGNITRADRQLMEMIYVSKFENDPVQDIIDRIDRHNDGKESPSEPKQPTSKSPIELHFAKRGFYDIDFREADEYLSLQDIHPLFALSNVDPVYLGNNLTKKAWETMSPALALATKFITAPEARKNFWHRLAFGNPVKDPATGKEYLEPGLIEQDFAAANKAFDEVLEDLTERMTFSFISQVAARGCFAYTHRDIFCGLNDLKTDFAHNLWNTADSAGRLYLRTFSPRIAFTSKFLCHIFNPESPIHEGGSPWNGSNLRFQIHFANLMCHELSHAIWYSRHGPECPDEPRVFLSDVIPEVGLSFDYFFAGGLLDSGMSMQAMSAMMSTSWRFAFSRPGICAMVQMWWVERWFLRETWERDPEYREEEVWGSAPSTETQLWPVYIMAERLVEDEDNDNAPYFEDVLYENGVPVATCAHGDDPESFTAPDPALSIEDWFDKVRDEEVKLALKGKYDKSWVVDSWGEYQYLKSGTADAHVTEELDKDTKDPESKG